MGKTVLDNVDDMVEEMLWGSPANKATKQAAPEVQEVQEEEEE